MSEITADLKEVGVHLGLSFKPSELEEIKNHVKSHLQEKAGEFSQYYSGPLEHYHLVNKVPHRDIFTMKNRVLDLAPYLRTTSVLKSLEDEFGSFKISDDYKIGRENVLMRFVRPHEDSDVGPFHCDRWFLEVMGFDEFKGFVPIKIWTAVCVSPGDSGLFLCPYSHKKKWEYEVIDVGMKKPTFKTGQEFTPVLFQSLPGDCAVFGYDFLHGGHKTYGDKTRVSLEFTILIPEAVFAQKNS